MDLKDELNKALENVDDITYQTRLNICNDCNAYKLGMCTDCFCVIAVKAKLKSQQCPREIWK